MFRRIRIGLTVAGLLLSGSASSSAPDNRLPIIDVHVHAFQPDRFGVPGQTLCQPYSHWAPRDPAKPMEEYLQALSESLNCPQKLKAPLTAEELRTRTFAELDRNNVALAVVSGESEDVKSWRNQRPNMIMPGLHMGRTGSTKLPPLSELRRLHANGQLEVLGEIAAQNGGMAPNDPALEPYFALAEELDIPVAFHMGLHAPGTAYFASLGFRASNGDPLLFEDVLVRHPISLKVVG
jgi:uncharacterized protein